MNPTPEQIEQRAIEAGAFAAMHHLPPHLTVNWRFTPEQLYRLVTRAMAEQAEADANAVVYLARRDLNTEALRYADAIRANAPKVTT